MKRAFVYIAIAALTVSCGAASTQVQTPDTASYRAVELTANSNSDRIAKLESELDTAKSELSMLRTQNRQLADSYDGLVALFKEHRVLTMTLIEKMNSLMPAENKAE